MKVIVAGYPKTGTKSMQAALTELGYNVYDYMENYNFLSDDWKEIFLKGGSTEHFHRMFQNVDAITDSPGCYFWDEIYKAFPEAKIILTTRESEDAWSESFENQWKKSMKPSLLLLTFLSPSCLKIWKYSRFVVNVMMGTKGNASIFENPSFNMTLARMAYRRHNSHVLQTAPKDKLLVYNVKEGWEPLCKFLEIKVPDQPFPHKNIKAGHLKEILAKDPTFIRGRKEVVFSVLLIILLIGYLIFMVITCAPVVWIKETCFNVRDYFS